MFIPQAYALGFSDITSVFSLIVDPVFSVFGVAGTSPVIMTAYLDKQKYMPGEQMTVTAAVEGAESVRAYIDTDVGVDEVDMILITGTKDEGTWQCVWVLHDTVGDKEYKTRIVAISSGGLEDEDILIWFDPNPGHSADEIGSGTMIGPIGIDGNLEVTDGDLNMNTNKITGLLTPTANSDAATKGYVDAAVGSGVCISLKCGDACAGDYSTISISCTPPVCSTGWTDYGTGCAVTSTHMYNLNYAFWTGYCERWCCKD